LIRAAFKSKKLGQTLTAHGFEAAALTEGGGFRSKKLGQTLTTHGFDAGALIENGFPPQAVWLTNIELFQFDKNQASRDIKAILGEDFPFDKITVKNN
jgi:hypothetical protein